MNDVIIVGSGIAACSLAWELHAQNKSFVIITDGAKGSSDVAAGVYNPMVLKRFTPVWNAQEQLSQLNVLYEYITSHTGVDYRHPITVARRMHDDKEAATWVKKSKRVDLMAFMNPDLVEIPVDGVESNTGYGLVNGTGWVDAGALMKDTLAYFDKSDSVFIDSFDFDALAVHEDIIEYKNLKASNIIFSEGYRMLDNPYFKNLPLQGNKGEVLIVKIPGFKLDYIIKSSVFLMPYKEDLFWVGATYDRDDLEDTATSKGLEFLTSRLERFLKLPYQIIDHKHGIRPTTIDRRPFVGHHLDHHNLWIFNGMGSRAVLIAPWAAQELCNRIYNETPLNKEMNISRF